MESLAGYNDLRGTANAPTWADFNLLLQKELTTNVYNAKNVVQLTYLDEETFALTGTYARVRKRWENEVTRAPNSQS